MAYSGYQNEPKLFFKTDDEAAETAWLWAGVWSLGAPLANLWYHAFLCSCRWQQQYDPASPAWKEEAEEEKKKGEEEKEKVCQSHEDYIAKVQQVTLTEVPSHI